MATWSKLTQAQRDAALKAIEAGGDPDAVAARYGLKTNSFRRTLRRLRTEVRPVSEEEGGEQVSVSQHLNTATAWSKSPRITTLEQLLAACEVDLDVWRVDHYLVNKWEVGVKTDGGGIAVEPLFQVKAWLVRRKPEPLFPIVQPVGCSVAFEPPPEPVREGIQRSVVWADPHIGFLRDLQTARLTPLHDRRALDLIVQIVTAAQPDRVDGLGDLLDLPEWSDKYLRSPEFSYTTQPSVLEGHWWLAQMRQAAPDAVITLHEGNHGARLRDAIVVHLQAAYDLRAADELDLLPALSLPKLLALHALGIEWVGDYPDDEDWLNAALRLSHGERAQVPGNTAKAVVNSADVTEVFGHIHRVEWVSRTRHERDGRRVLAGFCPGCACHIDGRVPGKMSRQQWQQGLAVVDYEVDGTGFAISPVVIEDGRAIWDGCLFEARDRLEEVRVAFPDWSWEE